MLRDYGSNLAYELLKLRILFYPQLVWKDTVKVGIATAVSPRHGVITVARYHPRGNIGYADDYVRNVAPLGKSAH